MKLIQDQVIRLDFLYFLPGHLRQFGIGEKGNIPGIAAAAILQIFHLHIENVPGWRKPAHPALRMIQAKFKCDIAFSCSCGMNNRRPILLGNHGRSCIVSFFIM